MMSEKTKKFEKLFRVTEVVDIGESILVKFVPLGMPTIPSKKPKFSNIMIKEDADLTQQMKLMIDDMQEAFKQAAQPKTGVIPYTHEEYVKANKPTIGDTIAVSIEIMEE